MKRTLAKSFVLALLIAAGVTAYADPIVITEADFSGSETTIDFNGISNGQSINSQYSASNVVFSGALFGLTNSGDTDLFDGSTIASNWIYWPGDGNQGLTWEAEFGSPITRVGFLAEMNGADSLTVEAFSDDTSLGSLLFLNPNGFTPDFLGLGDARGFNRIVVTSNDIHNGFFGMDNFRFGGSVITIVSVPEPATLALLGIGLMGMGWRQRAKKA